ncbi:MAG: hypothetical protein WC274_00360 [Sulfurimonas sp.]|jgi:hypothetical protein
MIKKIIFFGFALSLFASDSLSVGLENENIEVYTIQIFSDQSIDAAKEMLTNVPTHLRSETFIYKINGYYKGRYSQNLAYSKIKPELELFHKSGFKDAYILKTTVSKMFEELVKDEIKESSALEPTPLHAIEETKSEKIVQMPSLEKLVVYNEEEISKKKAQSNISTFNQSNILIKAQNAYKAGDESEAMFYYEMLLSNDFASQKVKNNLCYLYGKQGSWLGAKKIIDKESYQKKFIYAYAYGAVLTLQDSFYDDISEYIEFDSSGRLLLLTGYYFEKKDDMQRAGYFYQAAYKKNKTDVYNIFAYARFSDMIDANEALNLYKNILAKIDKSHVLYEVVLKRVAELGG